MARKSIRDGKLELAKEIKKAQKKYLAQVSIKYKEK